MKQQETINNKLLNAAQNDRISEAIDLLDKGANINTNKGTDKVKPGQPTFHGCNRTPLHYALIADNPYTATMLINKGADVFAKDEDGHTTMDWAITHCPTMVETLSKLGVKEYVTRTYIDTSWKKKREQATTALVKACLHNNWKEAKIIAKEMLPNESKITIQESYANYLKHTGKA